jgi:hemolysin III
MLVSLRDGAGPAMLALVWSLAALGIALDVFSRRRIEILQLSIYLRYKRALQAHGIWHLFVLAGSMCHFISVITYVR